MKGKSFTHNLNGLEHFWKIPATPCTGLCPKLTGALWMCWQYLSCQHVTSYTASTTASKDTVQETISLILSITCSAFPFPSAHSENHQISEWMQWLSERFINKHYFYLNDSTCCNSVGIENTISKVNFSYKHLELFFLHQILIPTLLLISCNRILELFMEW